jgi:hypothetical protein
MAERARAPYNSHRRALLRETEILHWSQTLAEHRDDAFDRLRELAEVLREMLNDDELMRLDPERFDDAIQERQERETLFKRPISVRSRMTRD